MWSSDTKGDMFLISNKSKNKIKAEVQICHLMFIFWSQAYSKNKEIDLPILLEGTAFETQFTMSLLLLSKLFHHVLHGFGEASVPLEGRDYFQFGPVRFGIVAEIKPTQVVGSWQNILWRQVGQRERENSPSVLWLRLIMSFIRRQKNGTFGILENRKNSNVIVMENMQDLSIKTFVCPATF